MLTKLFVVLCATAATSEATPSLQRLMKFALSRPRAGEHGQIIKMGLYRTDDCSGEPAQSVDAPAGACIEMMKFRCNSTTVTIDTFSDEKCSNLESTDTLPVGCTGNPGFPVSVDLQCIESTK